MKTFIICMVTGVISFLFGVCANLSRGIGGWRNTDEDEDEGSEYMDDYWGVYE